MAKLTNLYKTLEYIQYCSDSGSIMADELLDSIYEIAYEGKLALEEEEMLEQEEDEE